MQSEQSCVLAAILLADCGMEVTADNISKVVKAAGIDVKAQWPILFAQFLSGKNVTDMLTNISAGPAPAGAGAAAAAPAAEAKKEEKSEEEEAVAINFGGDSSSD